MKILHYIAAISFLATPIFAANSLEGEYVGKVDAKEGYFKFLSGGSSMNPIDLLRLCNVDMAAKEPIESALKLFGELLDEMEEML